MKHDVKYAYAASSVAVLFGKLMDGALTERMIDAENALESMKFMVEKNYGFTPPAQNNPYEYERLILEEERKLYLKLEELLPEKNIIDFLRLRNDCHNIKVILKDEVNGSDHTLFLNENGIYQKNRLKVMIRDRKFDTLPQEYQIAINEALEQYAKTKNPAVIDIFIDKACFSLMKKSAEKTGIKLLKDVALFFIDSCNVRSLIRVMAVSKSMNLLRNVLMPEGSVNESEYLKLLNGTFDQVKSFFSDKPLGGVVDKCINSYDYSGSLSGMDKLFDEYYLDMIKRYRFVIDGPEPVIYYFTLKEMEMKNMNLIMTGKINLLSKDDIRERIRVYYV